MKKLLTVALSLIAACTLVVSMLCIGGVGVSAAVTGADNSGKFEGYTTKDESLTDNAIVSYTNTKSAEVPTGIVLQSGASFAGIILAMGLMIMMLIGKRKEQNI